MERSKMRKSRRKTHRQRKKEIERRRLIKTQMGRLNEAPLASKND